MEDPILKWIIWGYHHLCKPPYRNLFYPFLSEVPEFGEFVQETTPVDLVVKAMIFLPTFTQINVLKL